MKKAAEISAFGLDPKASNPCVFRLNAGVSRSSDQVRGRKWCWGVAVFLSLWLAVCPAQAQQPAADVAIVLAVDASSSVNFHEFGLQMTGIAEALRSKPVQEAIGGGPSGAVALTLMQWSGPLQAQQTVPWRLISDKASAEALADEIENTPRRFVAGSTAIGKALQTAAGLLNSLPWRAGKRVIDISGDGKSTDNPPIGPIRLSLLAQGIVINGLPILSQEPDIGDYYKAQVIGGLGAFVEIAENYTAFQAAMERKLIREIQLEPLLSWRQ